MSAMRHYLLSRSPYFPRWDATEAKMERAVFSAAASPGCNFITNGVHLLRSNNNFINSCLSSKRLSESARARARVSDSKKRDARHSCCSSFSSLSLRWLDAAQLLINSLRRNFLIMHPCLERRELSFWETFVLCVEATRKLSSAWKSHTGLSKHKTPLC
jgi:hypothetical protein